MGLHQRIAWLALLGALALACSDGAETPPPAPAPSSPPAPPPIPAPSRPPAPAPTPDVVEAEPAPADPAALAARGKAVYMSNCIACHNPDPKQDGALGPIVYGSSRELVEARVMTATYPEGYTPRRDSRVMVALPHLEPDLDALAAYLNE